MTITRLLCAASALMLSTTLASASQGPGGGPGTAPPSVQLMMALMVYGASAIIVVMGLIGAARRR